MNIIMHYPDTAEKQEDLAQKVAKYHAKVFIEYINAHPCSYEEKINILDQLIRTMKEK